MLSAQRVPLVLERARPGTGIFTYALGGASAFSTLSVLDGALVVLDTAVPACLSSRRRVRFVATFEQVRYPVETRDHQGQERKSNTKERILL